MPSSSSPTKRAAGARRHDRSSATSAAS
jgi:hypothetical protein